MEDTGVWPEGPPDAYIALIPKTDGDAIPVGHCLPYVGFCSYGAVGGWFKSWVPDSVFSAGGGRSSVEAWYTAALDIEEV